MDLNREARHQVRVEVLLPVAYRRSAMQTPTQSITKNLSLGGLQFLAQERLTTGTTLLMELELPDKGPPLSMETIVTWQATRAYPGPNGEPFTATGVSFFGLGGPEEARLRAFIQTQLYKQMEVTMAELIERMRKPEPA